jgi:phosphohistidine phosphatase
MDLFLIRHAKAADGALYRDDGERPLTADGRRAARDVGESLARHGVQLDAVWSSPLVRAVETAELIAVATQFDGGLTIEAAMRPDGSYKQLWRDVLDRVADGALQQPVALVGHEPSIGHFLSRFLQHKGLTMSKGAVARLTVTTAEEPARLVWTLSPKRLQPAPTFD